jgi:hypothetical protein
MAQRGFIVIFTYRHITYLDQIHSSITFLIALLSTHLLAVLVGFIMLCSYVYTMFFYHIYHHNPPLFPPPSCWFPPPP